MLSVGGSRGRKAENLVPLRRKVRLGAELGREKASWSSALNCDIVMKEPPAFITVFVTI